MTTINLEQGMMAVTFHNRSESSETDDEDCISICFSDAEEGSCYSTFYYSAAGGSYNDARFTDYDVGDVARSRRDSSVSDCSVEVEIKCDGGGAKAQHSDEEVGDELRECRICHLNFGMTSNVIELGCDCKNDMAVAHSHCAERWFKIRGTRVCEICNTTAENVNIVSELELMQHSSAPNSYAIVTLSPSPAESTTRSFWQEHGCMNFLLVCMVSALVVSWLFLAFPIQSSVTERQ